jgi:hypothetical protein
MLKYKCDIIQSTCPTEEYNNCLISAVATAADEKLSTSILRGESVKKQGQWLKHGSFPVEIKFYIK